MIIPLVKIFSFFAWSWCFWFSVSSLVCGVTCCLAIGTISGNWVCSVIGLYCFGIEFWFWIDRCWNYAGCNLSIVYFRRFNPGGKENIFKGFIISKSVMIESISKVL